MDILKKLQSLNLGHLILLAFVINAIFITVASSEVEKKKITLKLKQDLLTTSEVGALKTTKVLGSSGDKINIFSTKLTLPNGNSIPLVASEKPRVLTANDRVVIVTTPVDIKKPGMAMKLYDMNGFEIAIKSITFGSDVIVADSGFIVITDNVEGYGENIYILDRNGNDVSKIQPYRSGYESVVMHSMVENFVIALVPVDKGKEKSKIIIINQSDGSVVKEINQQMFGPKSIKSNNNIFAIHDEYTDIDSGEFTSKIIVVSLSGEVINTISSYVYHYILFQSGSSIIICDRESVKSMNYKNSTTLWEKKYSFLYSRNIITKPNDISVGFNIYPLQLLMLSTNNLLAINFGQSSFNPNHAKYEAELIILDNMTGEVMTKQYLGRRNMDMNLLDSPDGIHVSNNHGYFSYQIISQ